MSDDLLNTALKKIEELHSRRFVDSLSPLIEKLSSKLSAGNRREFLKALGGNSREKRYQRYAEIHLCQYLEEVFDMVECPEDPADFCLTDSKCLIQVTAPEPGQLESVVEYAKPINEFSVKEVPTDGVVFKYRDALEKKQNDFQKKIDQGKISPDTCLVIAISPILFSEPPWAGLGHNSYDFPYITKALFPIGEKYFWMEPKTGRSGSGTARKETVPSVGGAPLQKNLFLDDRGNHISAAIAFGPEEGWCDLWRPIVVHNPNATNSLPDQFFPNPLSEYRVEKSHNGFVVKKIA
ncbi:MAG: hypothetical protein AAF936_07655 [Pseudomonadota bacterium]